jgi:hypothetical protein
VIRPLILLSLASGVLRGIFAQHQHTRTGLSAAETIGGASPRSFRAMHSLRYSSRSVFSASGRKAGCRKATSIIHSSHDLNWSEAKRFHVKFANVNIAKTDFVEVFVDLLEAENLKSKDLANEHPAFMPAYVAAVV